MPPVAVTWFWQHDAKSNSQYSVGRSNAREMSLLWARQRKEVGQTKYADEIKRIVFIHLRLHPKAAQRQFLIKIVIINLRLGLLLFFFFTMNWRHHYLCNFFSALFWEDLFCWLLCGKANKLACSFCYMRLTLWLSTVWQVGCLSPVVG